MTSIDNSSLLGDATSPAENIFEHQRVNFDRYLPMVDDLELEEAQLRELLETLWAIMRSFVELGFTLDAGQLVAHLERDELAIPAPKEADAEGLHD